MNIKEYRNESKFKKMIENLLEEKIDEFKIELQQILLSYLSYYDTAKEEKFYHNLILGMMLTLDESYDIYSNDEIGLGRADLCLEPKDKSKTGFIFEFKVANKNESLQDKAKEGYKQIIDKKYDHRMLENGVSKIMKLGVAFCGKELEIFGE